jgi:hypothetical protein
MNALWHQQHPLARNAAFSERIAWHREHQTQCGCRPVPASLREHITANTRSNSFASAARATAASGAKD